LTHLVYWVLILCIGIRHPEMHERPQSRRSASGPRPEHMSNVRNCGKNLLRWICVYGNSV